MSWIAVGATVVTAGAGIYSSNKASKDADKARKAGQPNIGQDIRDYVSAYSDSLPGLLGTEAKFRPKFQKQNLAEIMSFMQGRGGLTDLSRGATQDAGRLLGSARRNELDQLTNQAGDTRQLLQRLDPSGANMVKLANQDARQAQIAAQGLTAQETRTAEQTARESSAARGRTLDNSSIFSEAMNRDSILGAKRQEASAMTQNAFNMSNQFYSQPGLQQLNRTPQSYQAGQGLLGIGLSSLGSATPQLINPDMGVNVGAANRQNQLGAASAAAQASAARNASYMDLAGNMFGAYMNNR